MDDQPPKNKTRSLLIHVSEEEYRRFAVGRAEKGVKTAEYLTYLLDLADRRDDDPS
ncbi:hypothetical protein [Polyangium sp. 15x6]|uniref:ribbon-helix-helix protein n=1 Tax=Polyangium sp. 15x6 TaxID=3042687 RepID=UPI00249A8AEA|nr:hypothetical protein [Polyangium sp. 15x6]MDI3282092.1 hypothetical protein [Polyangium sp. 15x6]